MSDQNPYTARRTEMQDSPRAKSLHQERVESFMFHAGQEVPKTPTIPSEEVRLLRAKLILEEALETIKALGVVIVSYTADTNTDLGLSFDDFEFRTWRLVYNTSTKIYEEIPVTPDIAEVVDGCCDIKVVTTGTLSAFGVADISPQKAVDESNLDKFATPLCPACGGSTRLSGNPGVGSYFCTNTKCNSDNDDEIRGPYRNHEGKWIKGPDWQPPNWERILAEQGYMEDEPNLGIGHKPDLRTCRQWEQYFDTKVLDPDGWRQEKLPHDTPISKEKFVDLHMRSTTELGVYTRPGEFKDIMDAAISKMNESMKEGKFAPIVPVVDEDSVPVGPGDGLRKRTEREDYHYTAYQGHMCPSCKSPLSDEAVKRMCLNTTKFSCPECRTSMSVCTKSWTRPEVIAVTD